MFDCDGGCFDCRVWMMLMVMPLAQIHKGGFIYVTHGLELAQIKRTLPCAHLILDL